MAPLTSSRTPPQATLYLKPELFGLQTSPSTPKLTQHFLSVVSSRFFHFPAPGWWWLSTWPLRPWVGVRRCRWSQAWLHSPKSCFRGLPNQSLGQVGTSLVWLVTNVSVNTPFGPGPWALCYGIKVEDPVGTAGRPLAAQYRSGWSPAYVDFK